VVQSADLETAFMHAPLKDNKRECCETVEEDKEMMREFNEDMEIIVLPCKHCFVEEAIMKWLTTMNAVCPICRYELPSKEERIANGVGANGVGANGDNENIPLGDGLVTMQSVFRNMMQRAAERQYNTEQYDMQEAILASMSSFDCDD